MVGRFTMSDARASEAVERLRRRLADAGCDLPIRTWDGREHGPADRGYRLVLHEPWALRALILRPTDLRAGETYLAGGLDVDGSMVAALRDVAHLRDVLTQRLRAETVALALRLPPPPEGLAAGRVRLVGRHHAPERDAAAIRHHYDVGNDFYRLLLDRQLVYSCAYSTSPTATRR